MKTIRPYLASLALLSIASSLGAEDAPKSGAMIEGTVMLADLRGDQAGVFSYGTWKDHTTATSSGMAVLGSKGAQGNGGLGRDLPASVDLAGVRYIEVALGTMPVNQVPHITIALNDADGTQYSARLPVEHLVPGSPVWLRAKLADFRLNGVEKGSDGKMDWGKVTRWHLQGDWTTQQPMHVIFVALRYRR